MKTLMIRLSAVLCLVGLGGLYLLGLIQGYPEPTTLFLMRMGIYALTGISLGMYCRQKKLWWLILPALLPVLMLVCGRLMFFGELLVFLLPLVFWGMAWKFHERSYLVYYGGVFILSILSIDFCLLYARLNSISTVMDTMALLVVLFAAFAALWRTQQAYFSIWFFRGWARKKYELPVFWAVVLSLAILGYGKRVWPLLLSPEKLWEWLVYRGKVLAGNFRGDFSVLEEYLHNRIPMYNSLAWLNSLYGLLAVLGGLVLLAGALILLRQSAKSPLGRYLWIILLVRNALGLAANLLVIYSTSVYPLMMGLNPLDLLFVGMILLDREPDTTDVTIIE